MKYPRFFILGDKGSSYRTDKQTVLFCLVSPSGPTKIYQDDSSVELNYVWQAEGFDYSINEKMIKEIPPEEAVLLV